jgi:hypothetical protein
LGNARIWINGDRGRIEQTGEHDHELDETYNNANGLPSEIKKAIETILVADKGAFVMRNLIFPTIN